MATPASVSPSAVNVVAADVAHDGVLGLIVSVMLLSFFFRVLSYGKNPGKRNTRVTDKSGSGTLIGSVFLFLLFFSFLLSYLMVTERD